MIIAPFALSALIILAFLLFLKLVKSSRHHGHCTDLFLSKFLISFMLLLRYPFFNELVPVYPTILLYLNINSHHQRIWFIFICLVAYFPFLPQKYQLYESNDFFLFLLLSSQKYVVSIQQGFKNLLIEWMNISEIIALIKLRRFEVFFFSLRSRQKKYDVLFPEYLKHKQIKYRRNDGSRE